MFKYNIGDAVYYESQSGFRKVLITSRQYTETLNGVSICYTIALDYPNGLVHHTTMGESDLYKDPVNG